MRGASLPRVNTVSMRAATLPACGAAEVLVAPRRDRLSALEPRGVGLAVAQACAPLRAQGIHPWVAVELHTAPDDAAWLEALERAGRALDLPLVAAGDVHMHVLQRKPLQDVVTAVRLGRPVSECGFALQAHGERRLRPRMRLAGIYPPALLAATLEVAARCTFSLDEIRYRYPRENVPDGMTPGEALAAYTEAGARERYPQGVPRRCARRSRKSWNSSPIAATRCTSSRCTTSCGRRAGGASSARGAARRPIRRCASASASRRSIRPRRNCCSSASSARSATSRLISTWTSSTTGARRSSSTSTASMAASARPSRPWSSPTARAALRDVGKALGVAPAVVDAFAKDHHWFDEDIAAERLQELAAGLGAPIAAHTAALWLELAHELRGFPRHLSQHVGGFVLTEGKLTRLVPVEPASMDGRSIIQWDKDDLDDMHLMKVDVLALGMLSALRRALDLRAALRGQAWELADIPREDPATYDMICAADTVGVFQIESRAQMSMLPRLKPRELYDLVVEVAIVRPGPIQGGMVHPYLQARERMARGDGFVLEHKKLGPALERTLGVPIFQEQVMQIAMIAADFTPGMADDLRRSMAAWKRRGGVHRFEQALMEGMRNNGYSDDFAQRIYQQMLGFGEYGFPESHAYSFALLAYASSWFKRHEPACFLAALLNSQPMGFYTPSQLVHDARRHGLRVLPADAAHSDWDSTLEGPAVPLPGLQQAQPAVRLGLRLVAGYGPEAAARLMRARAASPFAGVQDLALRARQDRQDLQALAAADALPGGAPAPADVGCGRAAARAGVAAGGPGA